MAAAMPTSTVVAHPPITAEEAIARAEYTARVVAALSDDPNQPPAEWIRTWFLQGDGPRLLNLSAPTVRETHVTPHTLTFLMRIVTPGCGEEVLRAAVASVDRFGYEFAQSTTSSTALHTLTQRASGGPRGGEVIPLLTRLCELLLSQPSCTRDVVSVTHPMVGPCIMPLLSGMELRLLPLTAMLQRRASVPFDRWLQPMMLTSYESVEFVLRFLLADDGLLERRDTAPGDQTLEAMASKCKRSPLCSITELMSRIFYKLWASADERGAASNATTTELASSAGSFDALREWLQRELIELPMTCMSAQLRIRLRDDHEVDHAIAEMIQALQERPDSVRLDERNSRGDTLISSVLMLSEDHLRLLEPVIDVLTARLAAMEPHATFHQNSGETTPIANAFSSHLLTLAADVPPDTSFDRFVASLLDLAIASLTLPCDYREAVDMGELFLWLSVAANRKVTWRGVRRGMVLLEARDIHHDTANRDFIRHLADRVDEAARIDPEHGIDPRGFILEYQGTDRGRVTVQVEQAFRRIDLDLPADQQILDEISAWVQEWTTRHWPALRVDIESHLIPDLALIVLTYLRFDVQTNDFSRDDHVDDDDHSEYGDEFAGPS